MKRLTVVYNIYILGCFLFAVVCSVIASVNCIDAMGREEFRILPELNVARYKWEGTDEERMEKREEYIEKYEASLQYVIDECRPGIATDVISAGMTISICNLVLVYFLGLFHVKMHRKIKPLFCITCGIFAVLIIALRIFVNNSMDEGTIMRLYPAAYITLKEVFIPVFVLAVLTPVVKFSRCREG